MLALCTVTDMLLLATCPKFRAKVKMQGTSAKSLVTLMSWQQILGNYSGLGLSKAISALCWHRLAVIYESRTQFHVAEDSSRCGSCAFVTELLNVPVFFCSVAAQ